jgi:hypothetical protein
MRTFIKDLAVGDTFSHVGSNDVWLVTDVRTEGNLTRLDYRAPREGSTYENTLTRVNFTTVEKRN